MSWQQFLAAMPELPDDPTLEQWRAAVVDAERMIETQVIELDRPLARTILGDTLIQWGAFWGFLEPPP